MSAEYLLQEWGRWSRADTRLGYPNMSPEQRARGGFGTNQGIDEPPHIRDLNEVLRELKNIRPRQYEAISLTYISNTPEYKLGRRMRMSRDKAKRQLDRGIGFVEGKLLV